MARYLHQVIPIQFLNPQSPYSGRYRLDDPSLENSMAQKGMVQPPLVAPGTPADVIAGHKRVHAARKIGLKDIEVLILKAPISKEDAFLLAVLSNWNQNVSELDQAWTVASAVRGLFMPREKVLEEVLPLLGKAGDTGFYEEALEVMTLHKTLLDLIADEKLPFRGSKILARLSRPDQEAFAVGIAAPAALTTNQLLKTAEWISDLLKISGESLEQCLGRETLKSILDSPSDRKAKGERFFAALRRLRFPNLVDKEKEFASLSNPLQEPQSGLSVEAPPYFEGEGFTLRARIKEAKDLDRLSEILKEKRKVLNSLLDIVL